MPLQVQAPQCGAVDHDGRRGHRGPGVPGDRHARRRPGPHRAVPLRPEEQPNGHEPAVTCNCVDDLVPARITGKVVVCKRVHASYGALMLPAVGLGAVEAEKLAAYMHSHPYPVASFRFTCRIVTGENQFVGEILKPIVIAPAATILAAWPDESPLTLAAGDARPSRRCSGRHMHPDWTPAMIRSALMTTAATLDNAGRGIADNAPVGDDADPMAAGAGHVRPQMALDPGLVYDAVEKDYVDFLCTLNYTAAQIRPIVPGFAGCTRTLPGGAAGLNYPSFVVAFDNGTGVRSLTQTATKVSEGPEAYTVSAVAPVQLLAVTVTPAKLSSAARTRKGATTSCSGAR
ncbi:hypothetical protein ACP4OV_018974 [Aristida adscensionis]